MSSSLCKVNKNVTNLPGESSFQNSSESCNNIFYTQWTTICSVFILVMIKFAGHCTNTVLLFLYKQCCYLKRIFCSFDHSIIKHLLAQEVFFFAKNNIIYIKLLNKFMWMLLKLLLLCMERWVYMIVLNLLQCWGYRGDAESGCC